MIGREHAAGSPGGRNSIRLSLKVVPRASRTCFSGRMSDGTPRISLRSAPVHDAANRDLRDYLASEFGVGRADVVIVAGSRSRRKLVEIASPARLPVWLADSGEATSGRRRTDEGRR